MENSQETLEQLLDTHFPKSTHVVEDLYIEKNLDDQSIDKISNPGRIQWAVNSFKPFKSPGPDGFSQPSYNGYYIFPYPG